MCAGRGKLGYRLHLVYRHVTLIDRAWVFGSGSLCCIIFIKLSLPFNRELRFIYIGRSPQMMLNI